MAERFTPILPPEAVGKYLNQPGVAIIDARGGADARNRYEAGHLEGAIFMDLESQLSDKGSDAGNGGRHPLPHPVSFGKLLGAAGINPHTHVLVYDDKAGANAAARFWWMLRAAGHLSVQVIDGGLNALSAAGLPIAKGATAQLTPGNSYPVEKWRLPLADIELVEAARSSPDYLVIDVREHYRYKGESEPIDLTAGHIPGAVNAPYLDNLEANGRFRPPEVLAGKYKDITGTRDLSKVIVHCGSGVTACHSLLAMEVAGMTGASLYVGSWSEWSRRSKPVASGENP